MFLCRFFFFSSFHVFTGKQKESNETVQGGFVREFAKNEDLDAAEKFKDESCLCMAKESRRSPVSEKMMEQVRETCLRNH